MYLCTALVKRNKSIGWFYVSTFQCRELVSDNHLDQYFQFVKDMLLLRRDNWNPIANDQRLWGGIVMLIPATVQVKSDNCACNLFPVSPQQVTFLPITTIQVRHRLLNKTIDLQTQGFKRITNKSWNLCMSQCQMLFCCAWTGQKKVTHKKQVFAKSLTLKICDKTLHSLCA